MAVMNFWFHNMQGIFGLGEEILVSQEGLRSVELLGYMVSTELCCVELLGYMVATELCCVELLGYMVSTELCCMKMVIATLYRLRKTTKNVEI